MRGVVELRDEEGFEWERISDWLDIPVEEAMQQYREEKYDHWDTGWAMEPDAGRSSFQHDPITIYTEDSESETGIHITEIRDTIPVDIIVEGDDGIYTSAMADLSAEDARELARVLDECADILEGEK